MEEQLITGSSPLQVVVMDERDQAGFECHENLIVSGITTGSLCDKAGVAAGQHQLARFNGAAFASETTYSAVLKLVSATPKPWTFQFTEPASLGDANRGSVMLHEPQINDDDATMDDENELEIFAGIKCMTGWKLFVVFITLCIVDWLHIVFALLSMVQLVDKNSDFSTGATICFVMYSIKVITQLVLVISKWLDNSKYDSGAGKVGKATHRWYKDQEWFVGMTFNSFMMIFVFLFINEVRCGTAASSETFEPTIYMVDGTRR
jgi:hypothetical protein